MTKLPFTPEQIRKWKDPSFEGFLAWVTDVKPMIVGADGRFIPFVLQDFQEQMFREALTIDEKQIYKHKTICISWPRRHSKSYCSALICLWRLCTKQNENILILANSERQIQSVGFKLCKSIILNTPILLQLIGCENVLASHINNIAMSSSLRTMSNSVSGLFGERITCAWVSEIHAAPNDNTLQVMQSSMGDSINSFCLVDSTTDTAGGILNRLEDLSKKDDKTIYFNRREYKNLDEALKLSPFWIDRDWLKSREKNMLKIEFASQHLNLRGESSNTLFSKRSIDNAKDKALSIFINKDELLSITQGRSYQIGLGLDRAYPFSLHGDNTIVTVVAKVAPSDGIDEPHYYILSQEKIPFSQASGIKKSILRADEEHGLNAMIIESYNSSDIHTWALTKGYPSEVVHASQQAKIPAFTEMSRIFREGRIHFSADLLDLQKELSVFTYEIKDGVPKFGGSRKHKDDRVFSLCWAIHSLRQKELNAYTVSSVVCNSKSQHAPLCFLRSNAKDGLIIHCSEQCQTFYEVQTMFNQYKAVNLDDELSLPEFYANLVTNDGLYAVI